MGNCPKIKYNGTQINKIVVGNTEIYNLYDKSNKLIFHSHYGGNGTGCYTSAYSTPVYHSHSTNSCPRDVCNGDCWAGNSGSNNMSVSSAGTNSSGQALVRITCNWCGQESIGLASQYYVFHGHNGDVHWKCGKEGTIDHYDTGYNLGCSYTGSTTESDLTDVTDFIWFK